MPLLFLSRRLRLNAIDFARYNSFPALSALPNHIHMLFCIPIRNLILGLHTILLPILGHFLVILSKPSLKICHRALNTG